MLSLFFSGPLSQGPQTLGLRSSTRPWFVWNLPAGKHPHIKLHLCKWKVLALMHKAPLARMELCTLVTSPCVSWALHTSTNALCSSDLHSHKWSIMYKHKCLVLVQVELLSWNLIFTGPLRSIIQLPTNVSEILLHLKNHIIECNNYWKSSLRSSL